MPTSTRGFASMDPEKQREIARKGGESVPNEKRSFSQNPTLAAAAGRPVAAAIRRHTAADRLLLRLVRRLVLVMGVTARAGRPYFPL